MKIRFQCFAGAVVFLIMLAAPAYTQVVLDGSMGTLGEISGPEYDIQAEFGKQAGSNLFHSFTQFDINTGEGANFKAAPDTRNIISRITGGSSRIDGILRSTLSGTSEISGANLFLLNPAGVMFGPNASLDIGGSFHVSTADYLRMGENEKFFSTPIQGEVLSAASPAAFGFLNSDAASISVEGRGAMTEEDWNAYSTGLRVKAGQTLSLIGGDIEVTGGTSYEGLKLDENGNPVLKKVLDNEGNPASDENGNQIYIQRYDDAGISLYDDAGNPLIRQAADEKGNPVFHADGNPVYVQAYEDEGNPLYDENGSPVFEMETEFIRPGGLDAPRGTIHMVSVRSPGEAVLTEAAPDVASFGDMGNIKLSDNAAVKVSGEGSGNIFIRSGTFVAESSSMEADSTGDQDGGITDIRAETITLDQSNIFSDTKGKGKGGDISLRAGESVTMSGISRVFADATGEGADTGAAGTVSIEAGTISLSSSTVSGETYGKSSGGGVTLRGDDIRLSDYSEIFARSTGSETDTDAGAGGTVRIETKNLSLSGESIISSDTYKDGDGGKITISGSEGEFAESVSVSENSSIYGGTTGKDANAGDGGDVEIKAKTVSFAQGGKVGSESFGGGKGGGVVIRASESLVFSGADEEGRVSKLYTSALGEEQHAGDAGDIMIEAGEVSFRDSGGITASTQGPGNAGIIRMEAVRLELDNSASISSASEVEDGGNAGQIAIRAADSVTLNHYSAMTTETVGTGDAGDIELETCNLNLDNGSFISSASSSSSENAGDAGTIRLDICDSFTLTHNSSITTQAENAGKGKIVINIAGMQYMNDSKITTSIKRGGNDAGDIDISLPEWVLMNRTSKIIANAWEGRGGNIHIVADHFIRSSGSLVDASSALGIDGSVLIESPDVDVSSGLIILPSNLLDAAGWMRVPCAARSGESVSSFVIRGRDAVAMALDDWFAASP
jgi:filamentous hemagglutinin family protein